MPQPHFRVAVEGRGRILTLFLEGDLDLATAWYLERRLLGTADADTTVDLAGVTFVDASGIAVLVRAAKRARARRLAFNVRNARPAVRQVIDLAGAGPLLGLIDERVPMDQDPSARPRIAPPPD